MLIIQWNRVKDEITSLSHASGLYTCGKVLLVYQVVWVVRKSINSNLGLTIIDRGFYFSCIKVFFTANVLWSLRLAEDKTGEWKKLEEPLLKSYKTATNATKICNQNLHEFIVDNLA